MIMVTWDADIEQIGSGGTLTGVGVEIEQHCAQNGEEDAPRMRRRVHLAVNDVGLSGRLPRRIGTDEILRVSVSESLADQLSVRHQQ